MLSAFNRVMTQELFQLREVLGVVKEVDGKRIAKCVVKDNFYI